MKTRINGIDSRVLAAVVWLLCALVPGAAYCTVAAQAEERLPPSDESLEARAQQQWLDTEGHPLPFRAHHEVEAFLRTAEVVAIEKIDTGVTEPSKVVLEQGGIRAHAVFKDVDVKRRGVERSHSKIFFNFHDYHLYECAAYRVDRLLDLGRVPPAVARKIDKVSGTLQLWLEHTIMEVERRDKNLLPPDPVRWEQQRQMMALLDNLLGNTDSNLGNLLIDRVWNLWFIDHTRCFVTSRKPLYPERITHVERTMWQGLIAMNLERTQLELRPYLSRNEIKTLLARRLALIDHVRGLFERQGEEMILFDLRPPSVEPYPWPE